MRDRRSGASKLRPLVLISGLATGGAERVTVSFVRRLVRKGTQVAVCTVTARHDGALAVELSEAEVKRHDLRARRLADPLALLRLVRLLRREAIGLVHAHGQDASILGAAAQLVTQVPLVVTRHVLDEPSANWRQRLRGRLALAAARRAVAVVAVSAAAADRLAEAARLPRGSIRVIPNGVDLERFGAARAAANRAALRRSLGIRANEPLVLVPAVLRDGKGHDVLIRALPALKARVPSLRVAFAGGGERAAALRAQAQPYADTLLFLGPRDDMPELLAACELVVLPSLAEALPTALIEAAAAGRAVVATKVGGAVEVVEDEHTGLLVPPADAEALAVAVATLLCDPERARALGAAARRRAEQRFDLDLQVQRTLELWTEAAGARRP